MSNVVYIDRNEKKDFKDFINSNKNEIYANTPKVSSLSKNDDWATETEWDEMFQELSAKEK